MSKIYIWDCPNCSFYGDKELNENAKLVCPFCETEQNTESPFVEIAYTIDKPKKQMEGK